MPIAAGFRPIAAETMRTKNGDEFAAIRNVRTTEKTDSLATLRPPMRIARGRRPRGFHRAVNWFLETNLMVARLDKLSRNDYVQQKLQAQDCRFELIMCDEAPKMSATFFGDAIKYTKRYRLGQTALETLTRQFLLMTATPHNGKEEDFRLFMALLDGIASRALPRRRPRRRNVRPDASHGEGELSRGACFGAALGPGRLRPPTRAPGGPP